MQLLCRIYDRDILLRVDKTTKWVGLKITVRRSLRHLCWGVRILIEARSQPKCTQLKQLSKLHENDIPLIIILINPCVKTRQNQLPR